MEYLTTPVACAFAGCPSPGVWKSGRGRSAFALCEPHVDVLRETLQHPLMRFRLEPDYDNPTLWNVWDRKKETFVAIGVGQQDAWAIAVLLERDSKSPSENDGGVSAEIYPVTKSTDPQDRTVESQFWCPFGQHRTIYEVRVLPGFELTARCHDCFALSPLSVISHRWSEWLPSHPDNPSVGVVDRHVDALADTPATPSADFLLGSE